MQCIPAWVEHVVWWQVYPLGFLDAPTAAADPEVVHRLPSLENWLDYLIELGASGLALGPMFASSSHGYDTIDYYRIDPRIGDTEDFERLVEAAHERGIRVLLDGVFNHVGRQFPMFQQALREGEGSPAAEWFHLFWKGEDREPEYEHFEGHRDLVTLNHGSSQVVDFVTEVMCHWLQRGADGWRLDATYAIPAGSGRRSCPPGPRTFSGRVHRRRDDPRRLQRVRRARAAGLRDPVRVVEGDLEFAQRPQLCTSSTGRWAGTTSSSISSSRSRSSVTTTSPASRAN